MANKIRSFQVGRFDGVWITIVDDKPKRHGDLGEAFSYLADMIAVSKTNAMCDEVMGGVTELERALERSSW
jgi:hypothetical protein